MQIAKLTLFKCSSSSSSPTSSLHVYSASKWISTPMFKNTTSLMPIICLSPPNTTIYPSIICAVCPSLAFIFLSIILSFSHYCWKADKFFWIWSLFLLWILEVIMMELVRDYIKGEYLVEEEFMNG